MSDHQYVTAGGGSGLKHGADVLSGSSAASRRGHGKQVSSPPRAAVEAVQLPGYSDVDESNGIPRLRFGEPPLRSPAPNFPTPPSAPPASIPGGIDSQEQPNFVPEKHNYQGYHVQPQGIGGYSMVLSRQHHPQAVPIVDPSTGASIDLEQRTSPARSSPAGRSTQLLANAPVFVPSSKGVRTTPVGVTPAPASKVVVDVAGRQGSVEQVRQAEQQKRDRQAEERKKREEEAAKAKQREEEEARQKAEEETRQKAEEEARQKAEEEARQKAEEEARQKAEEEARQKAEEEARQMAEDEARQKAEEEEARRKRVEEEFRKRREAAAAEMERKRAEEAAQLEEQRRRKEEEARREAERLRLLQEEEKAAEKRASDAVGEVAVAAAPVAVEEVLEEPSVVCAGAESIVHVVASGAEESGREAVSPSPGETRAERSSSEAATEPKRMKLSVVDVDDDDDEEEEQVPRRRAMRAPVLGAYVGTKPPPIVVPGAGDDIDSTAREQSADRDLKEARATEALNLESPRSMVLAAGEKRMYTRNELMELKPKNLVDKPHMLVQMEAMMSGSPSRSVGPQRSVGGSGRPRAGGFGGISPQMSHPSIPVHGKAMAHAMRRTQSLKVPGRRTSKQMITTPQMLEKAGLSVASEGQRWVPPSHSREKQEEIQAALRNFQSILNKMTVETFDKLSEKLISQVKSKDKLEGFIDIIFEKALQEPHFSEMYAELCMRLSLKIPTFEGDDSDPTHPVTFKRLLLNKCQAEFEKISGGENRVILDRLKNPPATPMGSDDDAGTAEDADGDASPRPKEKRREKTAEEIELSIRRKELALEEFEAKLRRKMLGNIRFIGELFKQQLLGEKTVHECLQQMLSNVEKPVWEEVEALCRLLTTVGKQIDSEDPTTMAKQLVDGYMERIKLLNRVPDVPSRIRFMLMDVEELRQNNWTPRRSTASGKKLADIRADAEKDAQDKARKDRLPLPMRQRGAPPVQHSHSQQGRALASAETSMRMTQIMARHAREDGDEGWKGPQRGGKARSSDQSESVNLRPEYRFSGQRK